jgi:hypothetical protein
MNTIKRLWILPVVLLMVVFLAGCGGGETDPATTYTLTVEVEGEGTLTPSEGSHRYDQGDVAGLKAVPAEGWTFKEWVGAVADTGSEETTIKMDRNQSVKAVFVTGSTADSPPEGKAARSHMIFTGPEFRADYDAWNCSGLAGVWQIRGELEIFDLGTIFGEGAFTMPPRPDSGPWESLPFSYTMSGTLDAEDATVDVTYLFEDVVFTIIELADGPTLGDSRGKGTATVKVTTPEASFVVSETYFAVSFVPAVIVYESHPECD